FAAARWTSCSRFVPSVSWCRMFWIFSYTFFFFSSRRRHTRFSRDWSSDVCSSDLLPPMLAHFSCTSIGGNALTLNKGFVKLTSRSEERRVGKECRSRWRREHEKKNRRNWIRRRVSEMGRRRFAARTYELT